jgi:hypothetical protein
LAENPVRRLPFLIFRHAPDSLTNSDDVTAFIEVEEDCIGD